MYRNIERDYHTEIGTIEEFLRHTLISAVKTAPEKEIEFEKVIYWTDSETSLAWIKATDIGFTAFVENRLKEIRRNSDVNKWYFIEAEQNPADLITRMFNLKSTFIKKQILVGRSYPADTDVFKTSSGRLEKVTTSHNQSRRRHDVWKMTSDLRRLEEV